MKTTGLAAAKGDLPGLRLKASAGSSWAALCIAITTKPQSLTELLKTVGVPGRGKYRQRAFDAAADAWAVYQDALDQGDLPV